LLSKSIFENIPDAERLIEMEKGELAGYILEHLHSQGGNPLSQGDSLPHNLANSISQQYQHKREEVYKAIVAACHWLLNRDLLDTINQQGFFEVSKKGNMIKTANELQKNLEGKAEIGAQEDAMSPARISSRLNEEQQLSPLFQLPSEIQDSIVRFQKDYPDPAKAAFIMMKFSRTKAHEEIVRVIRETLSPFNIHGIRADDKEYHDDLFPNILTHIYGCGFGIAVFERIEADEFNPNVSLEVGYMFALKKPVCLLKDQTLKTLHTDLVGKLYKSFDPQDISTTIPKELHRWLSDKSLARTGA